MTSNFPAKEPTPDASGGFLQTVPLPMITEEAEPIRASDMLDLPPDICLEAALEIVAARHPRIATTIRAMWGYKECSDFIAKLILNGGDGMGHARIGFNQDAVDAMLVLGNLHDKLFGAAKPHPGNGFDPESGFSHSAFRGG
jgi:hypothetical protein